MKNIKADNLYIGRNSVIEPTATIRGINGNAKSIYIGDNVYIGDSVQIICDEFSIGDYSKIHHHTNIHGYNPCKIGHNFWVGQYSIIDSIGGTEIGNNVGVGAHSQLWSHIKYGDTLEGCNFASSSKLSVGNDVWFVGHCIVSPIVAEDKSMALAGSVIIKNMEFNKIYAGAPATCISDKIGTQFREVSVEEKFNKMISLLAAFNAEKDKLKIVRYKEEIIWDDPFSYFSVNERVYKKTGESQEISFMKYLLPEKAKFIPVHDTI